MDIKEVNDWTLGSIPNKCIDIPKIERGGDEKCIFLFLALEVKCDPYIWLFSGQIKKNMSWKTYISIIWPSTSKVSILSCKTHLLAQGFLYSFTIFMSSYGVKEKGVTM